MYFKATFLIKLLKYKQEKDQKIFQGGKMIKCLKCQRDIPLSADFCRYCGTARPCQICPCCQGEHYPEPVFCPNTGKNIAEARMRMEEKKRIASLADEIEKEMKAKRRFLFIVIAIASFLLPIGCGIVFRRGEIAGLDVIVFVVFVAVWFWWWEELSDKARKEAEKKIRGSNGKEA